ncbi:MAG: class I SAM-dependent methyltransferase [Promethearchaeota archaeon]
MKGISTATTPVQRISLEQIEQAGKILDLGAGGEGLVSRLEGRRVFAVDIELQKIYEARIYPTESQWILADARKLCFRDSTFDVATFWFSLGYFSDVYSKKAALQEVHRSLKRRGFLSILAAKITCSEDRLVFKTLLSFPSGIVSKIAYGLRGNQNQDVETILQLVKDVGYQVTQSKEYEYWFRIEALKP